MAGGGTINSGGLSITLGGLTVNAGGLAVTSGGLTVAADGLIVTGDSSITGHLTVTGRATIDGDALISGSASITGGLTINNIGLSMPSPDALLTVGAAGTNGPILAGAMPAAGQPTSNGYTLTGNGLYLGNKYSLIATKGGTSFTTTEFVDGDIFVDGLLVAASGAQITGALSVSSLDAGSGSIHTTGEIAAGGLSMLSSDALLTVGAAGTNGPILAGAMPAAGYTTGRGYTLTGNGLYLGNANSLTATKGSTHVASASAVLEGGIFVDGDITVTGGATISGDLTVTGTLKTTAASTVPGLLTAEQGLLVTTGGLTISDGGAYITGGTTVTGALSAGLTTVSGLTVTGQVKASSIIIAGQQPTYSEFTVTYCMLSLTFTVTTRLANELLACHCVRISLSSSYNCELHHFCFHLVKTGSFLVRSSCWQETLFSHAFFILCAFCLLQSPSQARA